MDSMRPRAFSYLSMIRRQTRSCGAAFLSRIKNARGMGHRHTYPIAVDTTPGVAEGRGRHCYANLFVSS